MKSCFGYVRVSTVKQGDGVSLEAQKDAILEYARRKDLTITEWWEEKVTAAKEGRPVFNQMVDRLKRGDAAGLVTHKIDRSARNYHDWAVISDLADGGIEFHIATESFDFNTYGGRMAADFMAVVAANYVRNLKSEIRKGQLGQLKIGLLPWAAPVGYQNNGASKLKTPEGNECSAIRLQSDQATARMDRLMDMLLDGLIDSEAFQEKKQVLLLEQRRLDEQLEMATSNTVTEAALRKFLELATNLALLYQSAAKHEKRRIVEWATSNRTASGKSVCFEPSKWLKGTKAMLDALSCAEQRDNSRTDARDLHDLIDSVAELSQQDSPLS